jgi:hypothetical protein
LTTSQWQAQALAAPFGRVQSLLGDGEEINKLEKFVNSRFRLKTLHSRFLTTRRYQVSILFFDPSWKSSHLSGLDTNVMILSHHHVFLDTA